MGAQASKEELLCQQVNYGNIEGIKRLRLEGAGLEFIDKEGRTPLMVACMKPNLLAVAKVLIDLGASVNAYRPGSHAGTPLHHAAKRGLDQTVNLLLSHGANPLLVNDDCHTPLDLAREKGHTNVVRIIENRICLFSGWLRELYGPSLLEVLAPQWVSRKVWVVVLPCDHRNPMNPAKFQLAIYPELQRNVDLESIVRCRKRSKRRRRMENKVAQPRTIIGLWKVKIEEPNFNQSNPMMVILDNTTRTRFKFLAEHEGDKQQLIWFYNACRGMHQANFFHPGTPASPQLPPVAPNPVTSTMASAPKVPEDVELAMAINASIQSAMAEGIAPLSDGQPIPQVQGTSGLGSSGNHAHNGWASEDVPSSSFEANNGCIFTPTNNAYNRWAVPESGPSTKSDMVHGSQNNMPVVSPQGIPVVSVPLAPPISVTMSDDGRPILYPSIDYSPVDIQLPDAERRLTTSEAKESPSVSGGCIICLDAPAEGACIPCGHMAGCMSCLNEIKKKKWGCPVCRANIDQVIKLYAV